MPQIDSKQSVTITPMQKALGGAATGIAEVFLFHWIDTIIKRLMAQKDQRLVSYLVNRNWLEFKNKLGHIVFQKSYNQSTFAKIVSLNPRMMNVATLKMLERGISMGLQPKIAATLESHYGSWCTARFGLKTGKVIIEGSAGALTGIVQVAIAPFRAIRTKSQTNPDLIRGKSIWEIINVERFKLYNAGTVIAGRNSVGSLCLFGIPALIYQHGYHLENNHQATFSQRLVASSVAAVATAIVTNPFDVVETRVQKQPNAKPRDVIKGLEKGAFLKGLFPKVLSAAPKLAFAFTAAPYVTNYGGSVVQMMSQRFFSSVKKELSDAKQPDAVQMKPR